MEQLRFALIGRFALVYAKMLKWFSVIFLGFLGFSIYGKEPYFPELSPQIEDRWRWAELEELAGAYFFDAREGLDGAIWFAGTTRVSRYDGNSLEHFELEEEEPIRGMSISTNGEVFVLLKNRLLVLRDDKFELAFEPYKTARELHIVCESNDGAMWISAWGGVYRIDGDDAEYYRLGKFRSAGILEDRNGCLWVLPATSNEIFVYDPRKVTGKQMELIHRFTISNSNGVARLFMDGAGRVWNAVADDSGRCYYYENYERKLAVEGLDGPFSDAMTIKAQGSFSMAISSAGRAWYAVPRGFAESVDGKAKIFRETNYLPPTRPVLLALSDERLLVGGPESKTYLVDYSLDRWLEYRNINYQCTDLEGFLWFLEYDGRIVCQSPDGHDWFSFGVNDGIIDSPNSIFCSSDGTLWVSGRHGDSAALSYRQEETWKRMEFPDSGSIFAHLAVVESGKGTVQFGIGTPVDSLGSRSGGVVEARSLDGGLWRFRSVTPPIVPARPAMIVKKDRDELWYGGGGLMYRQSKKMREPEFVEIIERAKFVERFEKQRWVDDLVVDSQKQIWAAMWGDGILQSEGEDWRVHTESNGLITDQVINLLASDYWEGVWAATSKGMIFYDGKSWSNWELPFLESFSREGVVLKEGGEGELWISTADRERLLDGDYEGGRSNEFRTFRYRPNLLGPDTTVLDKQTNLPEGSPIVIRWTGRDQWSQTPVDALDYSWRINGGDWSKYSDDTSIHLSDVGSGEHLFEVRARDSDWNVDATPASVSIYMIPPVWKRTWFIVLMISVLFLIAFLVDRLYRMRIRSVVAMEEFKLDFFTNISHELRNPLAVMLGPLESLVVEEETLKKKQRMMLVLRGARKMQGLVDQLLQFRKVELGMSVYRSSPGEIVGFIREAVDQQQPLIKEKALEFQFRSNIEAFICGFDSDKLQKIVDNLVSNAIKYSKDFGRVSVFMDTVELGGFRELLLIVEDQGVGIPPHEVESVLKPFYRAKGGTRHQDGFGIGLALVNGLVEICGGSIEIDSPLDRGKGTRVRIQIPLEEIRDLELETEGIEKSEQVRMKLLLVEDNVDLRTFMRQELEATYDIIEANNGREGFASATAEEPDLIITDVLMPEMDGFELCRKLRREASVSHVPIIMLTAKSSEEHSVEGMEAGADVYFAKPLNIVRLKAQVENLLKLRLKMKRRFSEQLVVEPTELTIVPADQEILRKAIAVVEGCMSNPDFGVNQFASEMGMGKTALLKKLRALTGEAPGSFIRSMRMKRAAQLLEKNQLSISETVEFVGIRELTYFSKVFKKEFGVSPSQYAKGQRRKLNSENRDQ